tara:strand:+ start:318 stop:1766 length:1449 start_codon:yes stop_codon:yes gene_type:complete
MPRQLKINVDANYTPTAPFTVNFAAPVIIEPGNKITMDKFSAIIKDVTVQFDLPESVFTLWYSLNSPNNQSSSVTLPSQHYDTLAQLLNLMTTNSNSVFSGYVAGMLPLLNDGNFDVYRDRGLKVLASATTGNKFLFEYVTSPFGVLAVTPTNMSSDASGNFYPTAAGDWELGQTDESVILTRGGGCMVQFSVDLPSAVQAAADGANTFCGLIDKNGKTLGLEQNPDGLLYLIDADEVKTQIPLADIPLGSTCQIYQDIGYFQLRCFTIVGGLEVEHFNSITSFSTALGSVDFFNKYNFRAVGTKTNVSVNYPKIKQIINMTKDVAFGATQSQFSRTVALDFTLAGALRAGLNVPNGLLLCAPQNIDFGSYTGIGAMNLSAINSSFDLALEILDLPLQTYQASTDRKPGSRQNIVCYFRPVLSNVGTNAYTYESTSYQWLDISVSYPVNLSSLSFRVFNPTNGVGLTASSMTFNLMINEKEY